MPIQARSADGSIHNFPDGTDDAIVDRVMKEYATSLSTPQTTATSTPVELEKQSPLSGYLAGSLEGLKQAGKDIPNAAKDISNSALGIEQKLRAAIEASTGARSVPTKTPTPSIAPGVERLGDIAQFLSGGLNSPIGPQGPRAAMEGASSLVDRGVADMSKALPPKGQYKATQLLSKALKKDTKSGEIDPQKIIDEVSKARIAQQPYTLTDVGGRNVQGLAHQLHKEGGTGGIDLSSFLDKRRNAVTNLDTAGNIRLSKAIDEYTPYRRISPEISAKDPVKKSIREIANNMITKGDNSELQKLKTLLTGGKDNDNFDKFVDFVNREREMYLTEKNITRGSTSSNDSRVGDAAISGAHELLHLLHNNYAFALPQIIRLAKRLVGLSQSGATNEQLGKILTDPNVTLYSSPGRSLLDPPQAFHGLQ